MADIEITASQWRFVEVGRVVLFTHGQFTGRLATIVEIIDHKRALVDGPSKSENAAVPRQSVALNNLIITPIVIPRLPRAAGRGAVAKAWEEAEVENKWAESAWAKRREQREKRRNLSDFDRFKVLRLKKQVDFYNVDSGAFINNTISQGEDEKDLYLTFYFEWPYPNLEEGSKEAKETSDKLWGMAKTVVQHTVVYARDMAKEGKLDHVK